MVTAMGVVWTSAVFAAGGLFGLALKNQSYAALTARQTRLLDRVIDDLESLDITIKKLAAENKLLHQDNLDLREARTKSKLW